MKIFSQIKHDLPASIVVFFVALPLCLGIALASGAPLFSGIISGVVGGIVVGALSGSQLGVSGPAAGLATIVFGYIATISGGWESFLLATIIAGVIQVICGYLRFGTIAYYFPSSVINGLLTGIGLLIILKQIPHALGYDSDFVGDSSFAQSNGENTFSAISQAFSLLNPAAIIIAVISILILLIWELPKLKKHKFCKLIPAPLLVVVVGVTYCYLLQNNLLPFTLKEDQLVAIPVASSLGAFFSQLTFPNFDQITNPNIYLMGLILAIVASLETLLCVEATDKLDPLKRVTPTNRELKAQGIGNIVSGLLGGLPLTQVIVRSSANITFGGKTKLSTILHGLFLLSAAISIPQLLNMIPLASLAAILIMIGYKLAKPAIFKRMHKLGFEQFMPFIVTILGMLAFDLLKGVGAGIVVALAYVIYYNFKNSYQRIEDEEGRANRHLIRLSDEVSFLNKGAILQMLNAIPNDAEVIIDGSHSHIIHYDVLEIIRDFKVNAKSKNISLELKGINLKQV